MCWGVLLGNTKVLARGGARSICGFSGVEEPEDESSFNDKLISASCFSSCSVFSSFKAHGKES